MGHHSGTFTADSFSVISWGEDDSDGCSCTCLLITAVADQSPATETVASPAAAAAINTRTSTSNLLVLSGASRSTVPEICGTTMSIVALSITRSDTLFQIPLVVYAGAQSQPNEPVFLRI